MSRLLTFALALISISLSSPSLPAQQPPPPRPDAGVAGQPQPIELTRGPVHEAFAQPYQMKSGGDFVITQTPPEPLEELPPSQVPESQSVQWIPGYWGWEPDEERFIWISGIWRRAPEEMIWNPGYWVEVEGGYTWVSGCWVKRNEVYLISQIPPEPRRENPGQAPSSRHFWVPGHWDNNRGSFNWRPGFWSRGYEGRVWIPFRYLWTPQGYLVVNGYWDYALEDRGVLYSPVAFDRPLPPRYQYSPTVITRIDYLPTHLFVYRPYGHYCFGDYYGYRRPGVFVSWTSRRDAFYDPLRFFFLVFNRDRYDHHRRRHDYFHDHVEYRPPRTWRDQRRFNDRLRKLRKADTDDLRDAFVSTEIDSLLKGERGGVNLRFDRKQDNRQRWNEFVQQSNRYRQMQKQHAQQLKQMSKIKKGEIRPPKQDVINVGPLQIETRGNSRGHRTGRVGESGNKGVIINPGRSDNRDSRNSSKPRILPGVQNPLDSNRGLDQNSDLLKKLREQSERMRKQTDQGDRENILRQQEAIRKAQEKQRDTFRKELERREEQLKKAIEDKAKRRHSPNRNPDFKQPEAIRISPDKQQEAFRKEMERRREILKKQAEEARRRNDQRFRNSSNQKKSKFRQPDVQKPDNRKPKGIKEIQKSGRSVGKSIRNQFKKSDNSSKGKGRKKRKRD